MLVMFPGQSWTGGPQVQQVKACIIIITIKAILHYLVSMAHPLLQYMGYRVVLVPHFLAC